ncbi:MAG: 4-demethylwyosine synthase TYW1 [Candidatus Micrarchaeota archaeon]|nr:4-demethylwyosine synthase TYW1 [Candidatus Micrarchaeota archaeon]
MARRRKDLEESKYYARVRALNKSIPDSLLKLLIRQKYHLAGEHSAAKLCKWAGEMLKRRAGCYKNKFYGIASHRCLQCTPSLLFCNHACVFCWRFIPDRKVQFAEIPDGQFRWDSPEEIAEGLIKAQKEIISGFGGSRGVPKELYQQAMNPKHAAISLTGEPMMYPYLEGLVREFHRRNMTTFLVTNGTFPERVEKWETFPTQFYVSMVASDEETYRKAIRPASPLLWEKYLKMLRLMPALGKKTRTVLRMTLARGANDANLQGYAKQIGLARPQYVEVKSMVFVGGARMQGRGLSLDSMLKMEEIEKVAAWLAEKTGYLVSERHPASRVVLLCRDYEAEQKRLIEWQ